MPSASCRPIHGSHAVDVAARRGLGISWYASHGMRSTLQRDYTAAWRAMLVMLHGVTGGPATSRGLEIWCPVYGHAAQRRGGGGIHYSTVVKTTAGRPLTMGRKRVICATPRRSFWRRVQSTLRLTICVYGCADPAVLIIRIRLIFGSTIRPNTNSAFFHYSVPNRIGIEYSVQPYFKCGVT